MEEIYNKRLRGTSMVVLVGLVSIGVTVTDHEY
jgi:hypothetical protein